MWVLVMIGSKSEIGISKPNSSCFVVCGLLTSIFLESNSFLDANLHAKTVFIAVLLGGLLLIMY